VTEASCPRAPRIAVVGGSRATEEEVAAARRLGAELATAGAVVLCGGRGGVMEAVARGAAAAGGWTVGILPGSDEAEANPWIRLPLPTGMGEARNALVVRGAQAVVAVGGGWGTLSEIALARAMGRPVALLGPGPVSDLELPTFDDPTAAAGWAVETAGGAPGSTTPPSGRVGSTE